MATEHVFVGLLFRCWCLFLSKLSFAKRNEFRFSFNSFTQITNAYLYKFIFLLFDSGNRCMRNVLRFSKNLSFDSEFNTWWTWCVAITMNSTLISWMFVLQWSPHCSFYVHIWFFGLKQCAVADPTCIRKFHMKMDRRASVVHSSLVHVKSQFLLIPPHRFGDISWNTWLAKVDFFYQLLFDRYISYNFQNFVVSIILCFKKQEMICQDITLLIVIRIVVVIIIIVVVVLSSAIIFAMSCIAFVFARRWIFMVKQADYFAVVKPLYMNIMHHNIAIRHMPCTNFNV